MLILDYNKASIKIRSIYNFNNQQSRSTSMLSCQSSALRTNLWNGIRARQIEKIKQNIRQLYNNRQKEELGTNQDWTETNQRCNVPSFDIMSVKRIKNPCQLCQNQKCQVLPWDWTQHFMRQSGNLCNSHRKEVISQCVLLFRNDPNFFPQLYVGLDFETSSFITVQRSLYLTAQILFLFLTDPGIHSTGYQQALNLCPIVQYILDGWFEYRLNDLASQINYTQKETLNFMEKLLRLCQKILIAEFLWIVLLKNWRFIQQLMGSMQKDDRILGLTSIVSILNNLTQKRGELPGELKQKIKQMIMEQIVDKRNINYDQLSHEIIEINIQIVFLSVQIDDDQINLRDQTASVHKWVDDFLNKIVMDRISPWCRPIAIQMLQWRRACRMDEQ